MKITLYMATSINGIIAGEGDETPWSKPVWKNYYKVAKGFKAIILGRRTYEMMKEEDEFKKIGNPFTVVITHMKIEPREKFVFVNSIDAAMEVAKKKKFSKVLIGGGSSINSAFMQHRLVDEIYLDIEAIAMGSGLRLFEGEFEEKLKLSKVQKISKDVVNLRYKVVK